MTHINKIFLQGAVGQFVRTNAKNTVCNVSLLTESFFNDKKFTELTGQTLT